MEGKKEKRHNPRVEVRWPVTIYIEGEEIEGESRNISSEGFSICCEKPLPLKKIFSISINPPEHQAIGIKGEVVWSEIYGINGTGKESVYGIGICLVEISEDDKNIIKTMINNYL